MNTRLIIISSILATILLSSCGQKHPADNLTPAVTARSPITVTTKKAGSQSSNGTEVLSGKIEAQDKATVSARMMGYVTSLNLEVGDRVVKGQKILTLKNNELPAKRSQIEAGITEAKVALQNVKANYDRMKALWEQESITRKDWDDISAQYEMMKAKVNAAESMRHEIDEVISYTTVTAPMSGVISGKMINLGDLVNPGVPLMTIEGDQTYEVVTSVSDAQISRIKKGMSLDVEIKSLGQHRKAVVSEISPSAVNTGGQFTLKAQLQLNNEERKNIFPGMYANVNIDLPDLSTAPKTSMLIVDKSALIQRGQLTGLYTVSNQGTAMLRWVRTGKDFGDAMEIVTGLAPGEEYIVSDLTQLVDGTPVQK